MTIYMIAGLAGASCYLISYVLLQLKRIDGNGMAYTVLNILAALFLLISLIEQFNLAAAVIQVLWITFGCIGLASRMLRRRPDLETSRESELVKPVGARVDERYQTLPPKYEPRLRSLEEHVANLRAERRHMVETSV